MGEYASLLKQTIEKKKAGESSGDIINPWQWAEYYRKYQGRRVNYLRSLLEPWKPVLEDESPVLVVCKPRKITASEQMINKYFFLMERNPYQNFAFAFPKQRPTSEEFSYDRVNPAIKDSPYLTASQVEGGKGVHKKTFDFGNGEQSLYINGVMSPGGNPGDKFRGMVLMGTAYDEAQLIPIAAHSVIDAAKPPDSELYWKWVSGTFTTPGNNLNMIWWENSDKHIGLIKCPRCNHWNNPSFKTNIRYRKFNVLGELHPEFSYPMDTRNNWEDAFLACEKCDYSLEAYRGRYGKLPDGAIVQYVPQVINEQVFQRGYFVSKLILGLERTHNIIKDLMKPGWTKRKKYNEIVGSPYSGDDSPFSLEALEPSLLRNLKFSDINRDDFDFIAITVDWGKPSWFAVFGFIVDKKDTSMVLIDIGHTRSEKEKTHGKELAKRLAKKWGDAALIICDHGYSLDRYEDFYDHFKKKRVYTVDANVGPEKSINIEQLNIDIKKVRKTHIIKASRDWLLENFETNIDESDTKFFVPYAQPEKRFDEMELKKYLLHCSNVYRQPMSEFRDSKVVMVEIKTERTAYFKDTGSDDHTLLLFSYASLLTKYTVRRILMPAQAFAA